MKNLSNFDFIQSTGISFFNHVKLKRAAFHCHGDVSRRNESEKFIQTQPQLTNLYTDFVPQSAKFKLNKFKIQRTFATQVADLVRLRDFLETQKALRTMELFIDKKSICETQKIVLIMSTICLQLEKLRSLDILLPKDDSVQLNKPKMEETIHELNQMKIRNKTVKKLTIGNEVNEFRFVSAIINVFDSLEVIDLVLFGQELKIDGKTLPMKLEAFGLINLDASDELQSFKYSIESPPKDPKTFEDQIGKNVRKVSIGHSNWNSSFQLTQTFCENMIDNLPNLEELELFSITQIYKWLNEYLGNRNSSKLKIVKLHMEKPTEASKPAAKRFKVENFY
jgi:hypothetical protein